MDLSQILENKLNHIVSFLKEKKIIVAFSGGVDSSLLAYLSKNYARETLLIIVHALIYPDEDFQDAIKFATNHEIKYHIIKINPLENENFQLNPPNRCYICKKDIFSEISKIKEENKYDIIIEGSNISDLGDYRPGMGALKELNIKSPFLEFNINKQDIRDLCKYFNLSVYSKPSSACFASRIPYNQKITEKKLKLISQAEQFLKKQFNLNQLRVRYHDQDLARIEVQPENLSTILNEESINLIKNKFKELGFCYITIDLEGFRSGSLNEFLRLN